MKILFYIIFSLLQVSFFDVFGLFSIFRFFFGRGWVWQFRFSQEDSQGNVVWPRFLWIGARVSKESPDARFVRQMSAL